MDQSVRWFYPSDTFYAIPFAAAAVLALNFATHQHFPRQRKGPTVPLPFLSWGIFPADCRETRPRCCALALAAGFPPRNINKFRNGSEQERPLLIGRSSV